MTQEIDQYRNKILQGDCLAVLKTLPSNSIQMCVTSPPYFALRQYFFDGAVVLKSGIPQDQKDYILKELNDNKVVPKYGGDNP